MVAVVQLVEHQVVILGVAGSSPVSHPQDEESLTLETRSGIFLHFHQKLDLLWSQTPPALHGNAKEDRNPLQIAALAPTGSRRRTTSLIPL